MDQYFELAERIGDLAEEESGAPPDTRRLLERHLRRKRRG